jgi:hypothetical protein
MDRITFRSTVRTFVWLEKEGALGVLAELVAEHAETPGGLAKTLSDLLRGEALNKVRPECLVLPMGGIGRLKEGAFQFCKGFSYTDKHRSTLLPMSKQEVFSRNPYPGLRRRQVSIGSYQFKTMVTESRQKTHRNT